MKEKNRNREEEQEQHETVTSLLYEVDSLRYPKEINAVFCFVLFPYFQTLFNSQTHCKWTL